MFAELARELRPAAAVFLGLTIITGVIYPLAVTGIGTTIFRNAATGSLIERHGKTVGSHLIGQAFDDPKYFWGRPSATSPYGYNAGASTGSNLGPRNEVLETAVKDRVANLKNSNPSQELQPPVDLVTASGSGLDPHISPAAAYYQINRVRSEERRVGKECRARRRTCT